jgi:uncharacterized protein with von Willebrand factor type A (vWA) domain
MAHGALFLKAWTAEAGMLIDFFFALKQARVPVSIKEFLILLEGLKKEVIEPSLDDFYYFSRTALVKDEQHFDKFEKTRARTDT